MKKLIIALFIIMQAGAVFAESHYTFELKKDLILGSTAAGIFAVPFFIDNPATVPNEFSKDDINNFDRPLMYSYDGQIDTITSIGAYGLLVLPALSLAGNIKDFNAIATYGIMYAEAFLLTYGTKDILKNAINRYRPYCYSGEIPGDQSSEYEDSFPSGHTSLAFMAAGFLSSTFLTEYPDSKWRIPVVGISYSLAAGIAAGRILSGNHFLTDVIVGAGIGSLYGYLIPALHLKRSGSERITLTPTINGILVSVKI
ncbi:phosphatase PAP2 family protein [Treponema primitia]|uniref:phosphatase PAP2 family protein n=1 Tax=Treponema primitia TaxID=88058 RepID=UPI0002555207|nr:phosphatase PAP2 family protein [Treponema primitia]